MDPVCSLTFPVRIMDPDEPGSMDPGVAGLCGKSVKIRASLPGAAADGQTTRSTARSTCCTSCSGASAMGGFCEGL
jgi:hypothetical protein